MAILVTIYLLFDKVNERKLLLPSIRNLRRQFIPFQQYKLHVTKDIILTGLFLFLIKNSTEVISNILAIKYKTYIAIFSIALTT